MACLRLFASAREAAGLKCDTVPGATVEEVLQIACERYGQDFSELLGICQVWCNGSKVSYDTRVGDQDEIAVLPPISGG
ncbi:MAG: MoaD/ThiS family protein [Acidimicrobiaceae bacterium]|nr:MoaD/ThiS family protein [Acidimicrobiaceae bacterium]